MQHHLVYLYLSRYIGTIRFDHNGRQCEFWIFGKKIWKCLIISKCPDIIRGKTGPRFTGHAHSLTKFVQIIPLAFKMDPDRGHIYYIYLYRENIKKYCLEPQGIELWYVASPSRTLPSLFKLRLCKHKLLNKWILSPIIRPLYLCICI